MATARDVEDAARRAGLHVRTYSPGDGITRYRFFRAADASSDYFGPASGIYTALGAKEALAYIAGHSHGRYRRGRQGASGRDAAAFQRSEEARDRRRRQRRGRSR